MHVEDTLKGGSFIGDQELVRIMCEDSPALITELEQMGSLFQRTEDGSSYALRIDGGHSFPRCPYLEDRTGKEMVKGMMSALAKRDVPIYEEIMIVRILKDGDCVCGALGFSLKDLEPVLFDCKAVILATGGAGDMYANTDNSTDLTGDGYALALEAGARLRDMEFVQFYPIGLLYPPSLKGVLGGLLYYSRLYNAKGERFMERYDPARLELSTRDRVSQAIVQEVAEGRGTPLGGVYCDLTFNEPGFIAKMTPALYRTYIGSGIDPEKQMFEIAPTCHFFMGGMQVDTTWSSRIGGLYGAGEVCGGMHGGNRLSQNALAEILVSGHHAGKNAAAFAKSSAVKPNDPACAKALAEELSCMQTKKDGMSPALLRRSIKQLLWEKAGV
ncbi:MAG: FAD-binding protein, partial [Christensenellaceae bacterium]|nr:FAD-binding protein [Christensenellaceae bacterium]